MIWWHNAKDNSVGGSISNNNRNSNTNSNTKRNRKRTEKGNSSAKETKQRVSNEGGLDRLRVERKRLGMLGQNLHEREQI